mmetsp:Transcript_38021/g.61060  ORF Transcript_38021/g.61060 Transcript_38021/m.61060 type:complete len:578 (+) Transcript_38021:187-1920(+)
MGLSVVAVLDGSSSCHDGSYLGYWGLPIWILLELHFMTSLYLVCEHHFVPSLQILGNKLGLSEDAQGATIMAAGSSSPEFFTALIGVLFYANENPGPGTIVGSAVFNVCIIVGSCAFFAGRPLLLSKFPLYRDSIAYLFASLYLLLTYIVISPGKMEIWESLLMVFFYFVYVWLVCSSDMVKRFMNRICCCCPQFAVGSHPFQRVSGDDEAHQDDIELKKGSLAAVEMGEMGGSRTGRRTSSYNPFPPPHLVKRNGSNDATVGGGELFHGDDEEKKDYIPTTTEEEGEAHAIHAFRMRGGRHQDNDEKEDDRDDAKTLNSDGTQLDEPFNLSRQPGDPPPCADDDVDDDLNTEDESSPPPVARQMSLLERGVTSNCGAAIACVYKGSKIPMELLFHYTIPNPQYFTSYPYCFVLTFVVSVAWLGFITFLVVDLAEKLGNCSGISEDLLGLSVLAIGSSLPDCISSILIAIDGKGDMAVCNALGSNVFDIMFCLGTTFFIQSCMRGGAPIDVESGTGFGSLILLLFILQAFFNGILYFSNHVLKRWHGYALCVTYVVFVAWFIVDYEVVVPEVEGGSA